MLSEREIAGVEGRVEVFFRELNLLCETYRIFFHEEDVKLFDKPTGIDLVWIGADSDGDEAVLLIKNERVISKVWV